MDMDFALRAGQFAFTAMVGLYSLMAARRSMQSTILSL